MVMKLDQIDLAFLHLGVSSGGIFDEQDLARSDLSYLGVGRTLDKLAYLKEKNLIEINGSAFSITDEARKILWDNGTPLKTRILRLLQIKSFEECDVARYLLESQDATIKEIDELRKEGLLIFTTIKKDDRIIKVCEIMQEGIDYIQGKPVDSRSLIQKTLDSISSKIQNPKTDEQKLKEILEKLKALSTELD